MKRKTSKATPAKSRKAKAKTAKRRVRRVRKAAHKTIDEVRAAHAASATAIVRRPKTTVAAYLESQRDLFKQFGVAETMIDRFEIVERDGKFSLVERDKPLHIRNWDLEGHTVSVCKTEKTYSEMRGFTDKPKGKYNDEHLLMAGGRHFNDAQSVVVGETAEFARPVS